VCGSSPRDARDISNFIEKGGVMLIEKNGLFIFKEKIAPPDDRGTEEGSW